LDSAIKRISRGGIIAVTNTDTAALTGTFPKTCMRKYWAVPKLDAMMHETGLRILIRKVQLLGMQYEKALVPVFSYYKDHYFRIFFKCVKGKKECDNLVKEHGMFNEAGPMWLGKLWDSKLASKMYSNAIKGANTTKTPIKNNKLSKDKKSINKNYYDNELLRFLKTIKDESKINSVGFFDTHGMKKIERKEELIQEIRKKGHKASSTHFLGTAIRADIDYKLIGKI